MVKIFIKVADIYIAGSVHVAVACAALTAMTQYMFGLTHEPYVILFSFCGTIVGYNFVKYDAIARKKGMLTGMRIKEFAALSACAFGGVVYAFFNLRLQTQLISLIFLGITLLYTLPFFPNRRNARNWAGVKIYMVALCWMGVTVLLPILDQVSLSEIAVQDVLVKCLQRFILIFVLVLIFEIVDLRYDDPHLKTVPQQIGVRATKILAYLLVVVFYCLEYAKETVDTHQLLVNLLLLVILGFTVFYANESRSRYYASFWVEAIPIVWLLLVLLGN